MLTVYGMKASGNCYKVQLLLEQLRQPYHWVEVDIFAGDSRTPQYLAMNPNGRVPLLQVEPGRWRAFGRTVQAGAFPIGIDVEEFAALTEAPEAREMFARMRNEYSRRKLLVGVDRLDYSKGLPHRMRAFR